ncbi:OmpH family outer membrane protein [Candidatus Desulfovibrio trichonymphae]|uniref:Outer membrane chaperone Skp n=1 Tax=Candidatus Desulfovibrio trichonymphae TaxID=1725232 RepID=A0A1J1DZH2_9BACT|nr:OmpH family outer membrane protein [Candidatus Desulfovibrio trichonymphae]BAV92550.1 outer membrane chaperone Skp [Candidatus Desulfovibrio trichonymphae]GHU96826.1 membrane protein [Deltaproteobacteria bacterium]GHU99066.1 membrane protein [Deltaproteobacteria bacterium]
MRNVVLTALAACMLIAGAAFAVDEKTVPTAKIGVVDMQTVATESDPAQAAKKQMEEKYGEERNTLEKQGEDLKKKAGSLKSPKTSEEKKLEFIRAKQDLDQKTRNFLRKVEQDEIKLRQDMVTLVFSAAYEVAHARGFNFVVDVTAGGVLYAEQAMDLTQDVLVKVNKLYKEKSAKKENKKSDDKK